MVVIKFELSRTVTDPRRMAYNQRRRTPMRLHQPHTQPIARTWINAVIFNDPPEPPPADVPPLDESNKEDLEKLTIRERLAAHRKRADCAGCHNQIDPLGFALENFGPTGVWRENYENGREVDVSNILFNQHKFANFQEFKKLIVEQKKVYTVYAASFKLRLVSGVGSS